MLAFALCISYVAVRVLVVLDGAVLVAQQLQMVLCPGESHYPDAVTDSHGLRITQFWLQGNPYVR